MKKISIILMVAIMAVIVVTLNGCGEKTYTLESMTNVSVAGYEGSGHINAVFDPGDNANEFVDGYDKGLILSGLRSSFEYTVTPDNSNLKNGDTVTITATYDKSLADKLGIKIEPLSFTYTVDSLAEAPTYDLELPD